MSPSRFCRALEIHKLLQPKRTQLRLQRYDFFLKYEDIAVCKEKKYLYKSL